MNIIKGLLTKDLLQLKSYRKTLIMFIFIFALTSITQETIKGVQNMLVVMLTLGFGMFSMATFNYDELAKADRYILTLPLTKKEIVLAKYLLVIIATIIGAFIGVIVSIVITFAMQKPLPNIQELMYTALGGILSLGMIESIQIPCIYKYGAEKGRMQIFIVMAIIALLIGGLFLLADKMNFQIPTNSIIASITQFLPLLLILATIGIYFISYKISYRIFDKKEI